MKQTLKVKILAIFIGLFVVLAANSLWAIINFNGLSNSIRGIMQDNYMSVVAAQNMSIALERQDSAELSYMFAENRNAAEIFFTNQNVFLKWLSRAEDNITEVGEEELLTSINELYSKYTQSFQVLVEHQNGEGTKEARDYYYNTVLPLFEQIKEQTRDLLTINQDAMLVLRDEAGQTSKNASYSTLAIAAITILGGIILSIYMTNKTITPIYVLIEKIRRISEGDYSQQLDVAGDDEIGILAREFNQMTEQLKEYEELNVQNLMEEKHKAEAIVESIGDGIIVTDVEHRVVLVNRAAERAFDIRESEAKSKHILEAINNQAILELMENAKNENQGSDYKEYFDVSLGANGQKRHYRIEAKPIWGRGKEIIGVVTLIQDVTKLKEVDNLKSEFVSTVAHEFRTPLTSISMGAGLLLEKNIGDLNDDQMQLVTAIKQDEERLTALVSDLLDLSRMESGKIQMDIAEQSVEELIEHGVTPFHKQAEEKGANISVNIRPSLPKVRADFNKISWVLTNLIGNALRYIPVDGTGRIDIEAKMAANQVMIAVSDNGKGIPADYQQKIFEKFVQIKGDSSDHVGSTGLGLAISKEIIIAHGGKIWVKSKIGEGSTFYFTLKVAR